MGLPRPARYCRGFVLGGEEFGSVGEGQVDVNHMPRYDLNADPPWDGKGGKNVGDDEYHPGVGIVLIGCKAPRRPAG